MADIALLGLGRDGRLRSRIIRAESEARTWAVEVVGYADARFDVLETFSGPFSPGETATLARNRVKNTGNMADRIIISFDWYNPATGMWENICRATTDTEVGPGECAILYNWPSCAADIFPACDAIGIVSHTLPTEPGTYYYGMKCWGTTESEPEYPSPTAAAALLEEGEEQPVVRLPPCDSYGDTDGDGFIRPGVDAVLVQAYIVGGWEMVQLKAEELGVELKIDEDEFARRADVNGDGAISIRDAQLISKYANGVTDTFPVCVPGEKPLSLECLFPRIFGGELFPRINCFLGGESFISCLFPRVYCLMTMTR
ncbi:MAG TPA: hypothetical protein ENF26_01045 [Methanomicrobia archaeon]|nr:hypothetical protein [Methanomicrobia archaeon]HEX58718.1 hypothetical protein [Methanomicrobia archaeon]